MVRPRDSAENATGLPGFVARLLLADQPNMVVSEPHRRLQTASRELRTHKRKQMGGLLVVSSEQ